MSLETPRNSFIPASLLEPPPLVLASSSMCDFRECDGEATTMSLFNANVAVDALVLPSALSGPSNATTGSSNNKGFPSLSKRTSRKATLQRSSSEYKPHQLNTKQADSSMSRSTTKGRSHSDGSLMDCVSHMSLDDISTATASMWTPVCQGRSSSTKSSQQQPSRETLQWLAASFSSPETASNRPLSTTPAKRKTPSSQETPLQQETEDEDAPLPFLPLALPPNNSADPPPRHHNSRLLKKSRNCSYSHKPLPMFPSSPDLEFQAMPTYYHVPYFSPIGGVTMANVSFVARHFGTKEPSPRPEDAHARKLLGIPEAAGLPTLDDDDDGDSSMARPPSPQRPNGWLRMKRRSSLLRALRLTASD